MTETAYHSSRELQERITPTEVLELLREGNQRFQNGDRLPRDYAALVKATSGGQTPLAAVLGCIDSRVPVELVFDVGIGDVFSIRVAGNVSGSKSLGSIEYAVAVAGVKLLLVLGHTRCGAVTSSVKLLGDKKDVTEATGCKHLYKIVDEVAPCIDESEFETFKAMDPESQNAFVDEIAKRNVLRAVSEMLRQSDVIQQAVDDGNLMVAGGMYDVETGNVTFLTE